MTPPSRRQDEDGQIAIWLLGLSVAVLFVGGISVDLWRAYVVHRDLAGVVDAASIAGASAIHEATFRDTGQPLLEPDRAAAIACLYLREHTDPPVPCDGVDAAPEAIQVSASREVPLTLMRVLSPDGDPVEVTVSAVAEPHRSR